MKVGIDDLSNILATALLRFRGYSTWNQRREKNKDSRKRVNMNVNTSMNIATVLQRLTGVEKHFQQHTNG